MFHHRANTVVKHEPCHSEKIKGVTKVRVSRGVFSRGSRCSAHTLQYHAHALITFN